MCCNLYVEKQLVSREATASSDSYYATSIWEAVKTNNLREVYRLIATSDVNIVNTTYDALGGVNLHHDSEDHDLQEGFCDFDEKRYDPAACQKIKDSSKSDNCLQGCSLLHLACQAGYPLMLELLLQFGADINKCDYHRRTPLHHCISAEHNQLAKILLRRGARTTIKDGGGLGPLERAMEMGAITDEELFVLLAEFK
ncbi:hypothetical protein RJ640_007079 [Escallonia rubra]|uniref:Uncharacterized protein n=1 Tax=Escallonia rubra TaxID=112253 RepID=A0AA88UFC8_9ASTE|nr:hypothetical protein RJ640_007079 [Escallonia rubra]